MSGSCSVIGWCTLVGALGGVVLVTVATGGGALAFIGPAMTLTGSGVAAGVGAGGALGLVTGAGLALNEPDLSIVAARLGIELTDAVRLDIVRVLAGAATCGTAGPTPEAKRAVVLREALGLSAAAVPEGIREKIDDILAREHVDIGVSAALQSLDRYTSLKEGIYHGCIRVMITGTHPSEAAAECFLAELAAAGFAPKNGGKA